MHLTLGPVPRVTIGHTPPTGVLMVSQFTWQRGHLLVSVIQGHLTSVSLQFPQNFSEVQ